MKKYKSNNNDNLVPIFRSPKFSMVLLLVTSLICVITIVFSSFSWFTPFVDTNNYKNMEFVESSVPFRSETCTFTTYQGTMLSDGTISYSSTPVTSAAYPVPTARPANTTNNSTNKDIPGYLYFKTDVINNSYEYSSCISMFFSQINKGVNVGVTYPSNSYRTVSSDDQYEFYLIRNAYVKVKVDTDVYGPGLLSIEWFVRNDSTDSMSITPSNLYLTYS